MRKKLFCKLVYYTNRTLGYEDNNGEFCISGGGQVFYSEIRPIDIDKLKVLIIEKSWWETVDTIDAFVGDLVLQDNRLIETMLEWSVSDSIWLRRVAIDYH